MPAKFQLRKGTTGKFRFVVLSSNGQVVATSEAYERKASALAGIRSIEKIVQSNAAIEDTTTKEYAEAAAAKKAAKKNGAKKPARAKAAAKKVVTRATASAPAKKAAPRASAAETAPASSTRTAKAAVKGAAKSGTWTPVRKAPPPPTTPPSQLTPKI